MKVTHEGKEIEVFTPEEVATREQAASAKAVEDFKAANPDKTEEINGLKNKLVEAEDLLKKAEEDGGNKGQIERLRKERDDAKKAAEGAQVDFDKKFSEKFESLRTEMFGDTKKEILDALSGGDAEKRKKIEFEFDKYRTGDNTPAQIKERMAVAFQIVTGEKPTPSILDGRTGAGDRGGGGGTGGEAGKAKEVTPNQKAIGTVLGITDKDRENHAAFIKSREAKKALGLIPPGAN